MICLNRTMDSELLVPHFSRSLIISWESRRHKTRTSRLRAWMLAFLVLGAAFSLDARADYWFKVNDASQIQYMVGSPQIYLRNLNAFDSTVLGCCYNYRIDVSTDAGKAAWATLLAKMQTQQPIWIYIASQTVAGSATVAWFA
jgi:hypothetical protein